MSEYLRMSGLYWALTTLELLDKPNVFSSDEIMEFIQKCINEDGGISPCEKHDPHILYTLSTVQVIPRSLVSDHIRTYSFYVDNL